MRVECLWPETARNGELEKTLEKRENTTCLEEDKSSNVSVSTRISGYPADKSLAFSPLWMQ